MDAIGFSYQRSVMLPNILYLTEQTHTQPKDILVLISVPPKSEKVAIECFISRK